LSDSSNHQDRKKLKVTLGGPAGVNKIWSSSVPGPFDDKILISHQNELITFLGLVKIIKIQTHWIDSLITFLFCAMFKTLIYCIGI